MRAFTKPDPRLWPICAAVLLLGGATSATAETDGARGECSTAYGECMNASGGITSEMRICMAEEYRRRDADLNLAYRAALGRMQSDVAKQDLRQAQRGWLADRWDICDEEVDHSGMEGGTAALLIKDSCRLRVLSERIGWLLRQPI